MYYGVETDFNHDDDEWIKEKNEKNKNEKKKN